MGFIQAFRGAFGGTFADQWKDFYGPKQGVSGTAAVFPGVAIGTNKIEEQIQREMKILLVMVLR